MEPGIEELKQDMQSLCTGAQLGLEWKAIMDAQGHNTN